MHIGKIPHITWSMCVTALAKSDSATRSYYYFTIVIKLLLLFSNISHYKRQQDANMRDIEGKIQPYVYLHQHSYC